MIYAKLGLSSTSRQRRSISHLFLFNTSKFLRHQLFNSTYRIGKGGNDARGCHNQVAEYVFSSLMVALPQPHYSRRATGIAFQPPVYNKLDNNTVHTNADFESTGSPADTAATAHQPGKTCVQTRASPGISSTVAMPNTRSPMRASCFRFRRRTTTRMQLHCCARDSSATGR